MGSSILSYLDFSQQSFWISLASIAFNPTFWNIAARQEYHNKVITKLFGSPRNGCYALAVTIFSIGIIRDALYERALRDQPTHPDLLNSSLVKPIAGALFLSGNVLVLSSMWALGVTGTYLGDYFGILMDHIVTGFPFNVTGSPMYWGSTMSFLGTSLWFGKPAGIILTLAVYVAYSIALKFEDPFTAEIYAKRERSRTAGKKGN
ncbi:phospholipid methyltransferase [Tothia fuscella]|uniref:Phosphatidyl-N-methylethanolamine N-methyltransferase n=1 Tax=Tothia fuscella TaxID=1048955 RepID=A0A9P4NSD7_9PEZI|nr:phospholipid methyltransferase [Tothia fuscella]